MDKFRNHCWAAISSPIQCYHSDINASHMVCIVEPGVVYSHSGVGDGDLVAQDGYPLQSEGRTPGDKDSGGVDDSHIEVTD